MTTWFRFVMRVFPPAFRDRFEAEVIAEIEREVEGVGRGGVMRRWFVAARATVDLVVAGLAERRSPAWPDGEMGNRGELETGVGAMTTGWLRDLRHALRTLRRAPGFTLAAVITLALALGVNGALFSVFDAVLLRPLPYADADRLVQIAASAPGSDLPDEFGVSAEFFVQYREEATRLESLATFNTFTSTVRSGDRVERLLVSAPSLSLFETLGVEPALGRWPRPGEGQQVALLSHGLWTTWFGADPEVVGRDVWMIDGPKTVVGVMPADFRFPVDDVQGWVPAEMTAENLTPGRFGMQMVGRLAPGADEASLREELAVLASRLPERFGGSPGYARIIEQHIPVVRRLDAFMFGPVRTALRVLMAAVTVVLLIACANVANLFAVRSETRARELAVRRAMGAGRGRLLRAQFAEAMVVAVLAAGLAVAFVLVTLPLYLALVPGRVPRLDDVHLSSATLVFTVVAAGLTALACGLGPALRASRADLGRLRDGSRGSTRQRHRGRNALVVLQTALALVLLAGSGLLIRSFQALRAVDPGYDVTDVLTFQFAPEEEHLVDGPTWARFHLDMMDRLRALPGVESVGIVENVPLNETPRGVEFTADGVAPGAGEGSRGGLTFAAGDYFETMGIEVLRGRSLAAEDGIGAGTVVVSEALAEALWPGQDPIGRTLRTSLLDAPHEVVGVVEDVVQTAIADGTQPLAYFPMVGPAPRAWALSSPGYVVRSARAEGLVAEVRSLIREVSPSAPMYRVFTMEQLSRESTLPLAFTMLNLVVVAVLALVLGAVGLYGILSQVVADRTREIGVRMALGAERGRVSRMVVGQGVRVVVVGIVLGTAVAALATRGLRSFLYGVEPLDAPTFVLTAVALAVVGLLASWIPARRASRVDPIESMRAG